MLGTLRRSPEFARAASSKDYAVSLDIKIAAAVDASARLPTAFREWAPQTEPRRALNVTQLTGWRSG
jgi:hypothetical protein